MGEDVARISDDGRLYVRVDVRELHQMRGTIECDEELPLVSSSPVTSN